MEIKDVLNYSALGCSKRESLPKESIKEQADKLIENYEYVEDDKYNGSILASIDTVIYSMLIIIKCMDSTHYSEDLEEQYQNQNKLLYELVNCLDDDYYENYKKEFYEKIRNIDAL